MLVVVSDVCARSLEFLLVFLVSDVVVSFCVSVDTIQYKYEYYIYYSGINPIEFRDHSKCIIIFLFILLSLLFLLLLFEYKK